MKIRLKSSLSVFVALILGCGALGAKTKEAVVADAAKSVEHVDTQLQQQAEEAKKKAQELAAAVKAQSQEVTELLVPAEENIIAEENSVLEDAATVDVVR